MNPSTRDEIVDALRSVHRDGDAMFDAFDTGSFFRRFGESWSPAETVRHLTKATRPVTKALRMPRLLLKLLFGTPRRKETYAELQTRYEAALAAGGKAGRFGPSDTSRSDHDAWRRDIMNDRHNVADELAKEISRWSERDLDRYRLPHPLLGKLSVREMLLFTILHHIHHMDIVKRRSAQAARAST